MESKQTVNVSEILIWECPECCSENRGPSWLLSGDSVKCEQCGTQCVVAEHYADCRPQRFEGKKASV